MKQAKDLATAIKNITSKGDQVLLAVVESVDKSKATCEVLFNDLELGDVRLQAVVKADQKGFKVFPIAGSWVGIQKLGDKGDYFICLVSEIDQLICETDNTIIDVKDGILLKRGTDTLAAAVVKFIEALELIFIVQGNNPDYVALAQAKLMFQNILKDA
jgi:hypothetical protein